MLEEFKAVQAAFEQLRYVKTPETIRHYFDALPEQIRTANNLSQNLEVMQLESHTYQIKQVLLWLEQLQSMRDPLRDTVDELNTYYDTMHVDGENEEKIIIE